MIASSQIPLSELDLGRMDAEFYHPKPRNERNAGPTGDSKPL